VNNSKNRDLDHSLSGGHSPTAIQELEVTIAIINWFDYGSNREGTESWKKELWSQLATELLVTCDLQVY